MTAGFPDILKTAFRPAADGVDGTAVRAVESVERKATSGPKGIDPKVLMSYYRWMAKHLDEMVRNHPGKFIAVCRIELDAVGDSGNGQWQAADLYVDSGSFHTLIAWQVR